MIEISDKARALYQKGLSAFQSQNWDYAIALFTTVLEVAPGLSEARTRLHLAELRKLENRKFHIALKISSLVFNIAPYIKAFIYWQKKDWTATMRELEKPLRSYPKDIFILRKLAEASEQAEMVDTSCGIYEIMHVINPSDLGTLKKLGALYRQLNNPEKARAYFEKAVLIAPADYEARKGIQDLAALGTIAKGWDDTSTYRDKILDEIQADIFEKEAKIVKSEEDKSVLISSLEKNLKERPGHLPTLKKLADLYTSLGNYDKALNLYSSVDIRDPDIRKEVFNIKILQLKDKPDQMKKLIIEDTQDRVKDFPTHLPLRYEMGTVYMENSMMDQAIGEFQLSVKDPKYKIASLNNMGLCFYKKGIFDLSINQFKKAINDLNEWDDTRKEITYNLGMALTALGEREKAVAEFKKIYEQDIRYRDVAQKIAGAL